MINQSKKFIYLISPSKINNLTFFKNLNLVLKSNKVNFFQLRLKRVNMKKKILLAKKIYKICKKNNVKFIINDDPYLALKVKADGCHVGQKDTSIIKSRQLLKKKILGVTCHNSKRLALNAKEEKADYIAFGSFYKTTTKKVKYFAKKSILKWSIKNINIPTVAIGGVNETNYKELLKNGACYVAFSSYIWNNNKYSPFEAVSKIT